MTKLLKPQLKEFYKRQEDFLENKEQFESFEAPKQKKAYRSKADAGKVSGSELRLLQSLLKPQ